MYVGNRSRLDITLGVFALAGRGSGHDQIIGMRTPPSFRQPFTPDNGPFQLALPVAPPLSEKNVMSVLSSVPDSRSIVRIRPIPRSIAHIIAA